MTATQKIKKNTPVLYSEFEAYQLCAELKRTHGVQLGIVACDDSTYRVATFEQIRKIKEM